MEELEEEVYDAIKSLGIPENIEVKIDFHLKGVSKNTWRTDLCIIAEHEELPLAIIECKDVQSPLPSTHKTQYQRAYTILGDLKNFNCPKFLIIPLKLEFENKRKNTFNPDSLFETIGAKVVEWWVEDQKNAFLENIRRLFQK